MSFLHQSPDMDVNTLKLKMAACTLTSYSLFHVKSKVLEDRCHVNCCHISSLVMVFQVSTKHLQLLPLSVVSCLNAALILGQFLLVSTVYSCHHSDTGQPWSHLATRPFSTPLYALLCTYQTVTWPWYFCS